MKGGREEARNKKEGEKRRVKGGRKKKEGRKKRKKEGKKRKTKQRSTGERG